MDFVVYKKFVDEEPAQALIQELNANNIETEMAHDRESLDSLYGQKVFAKQYFVKIKHSDIVRADALLEEQSKKQLDSVDKDHYLFTFTNDELHEIMEKPDEWNEFDFQLARKILAERGHTVDESTIAQLKNERFKSLAEPMKSNPSWVIIGYVLAILGGIIGTIMGWHMSTHKKPLPNGQVTYAFTKSDRAHGRIIMVIGIVVIALGVISRVLDNN
jgi:hypothetical protein